MRVPVSWLREYVAFHGSVEELAELLSMSGSEVENIEWVGAPRDAGNVARFVVGRVLTRQKHPNADKLSLCTVDVGESNGGVRQIVCGADNFQAGDTVAVSLTGAVLENGLKLRKAAIRGVESDGMMMSEKELGYEDDSAGIVILPSEWTVGASLAQYLPVSEAVLEIEVTPNRPDCFSVYGIAREVAAAAGLPLSAPPVAEPPTGGAPVDTGVAVEVIDADLCPRYGARVIRGLHIAESPPWLKARLTHAGMRPISNVVDVTNYVMLAVGQPLHAFDQARIEGSRLIVRRAAQGERIVTLDEVERTLDAGDLVIADARRPLVIAGVFGAVDAEVSPQTVDVVLEAANFNGPNILRTEHRTGIRSEASNRFEKGLDPHLTTWGLAMASRLFHELCGGAVAPGTIDVRGELPAPPRLRLRPQRCDALLGLHVPGAEQAAILRRLECEVEKGGAELVVTPPTFRSDLEREVDLIEEVGRIKGLDLVPETLPARRGAVGGLTAEQKLRRAAYDALAGCGLDEIATYTFISREALAGLGLDDGDVRSKPIALANPMSAEQAVMRTTLLPGLLSALRENLTRQKRALQLFEGGHVYLDDDQTVQAPAHAVAAGAQVRLPHEPEMVGMALLGPLYPENWTGLGRPTDLYTLKGIVERLLTAVGVAGVEFAAAKEPFLHPGKSAAVVFGTRHAGWLGLLRPDVAARFGVEEGEVYAAELSLDELFRHTRGVPLFTDLVTFPPASQDLAVVVDRDVPAADVLALVRQAGGKLLHQVSLFDVYEGDQVAPGKRSLALRLMMRSPERTLTEKDIGNVRQRVLSALEGVRGFSAQPRMNPAVGLVLEGGGMRAAYTAGVLDCFMDQQVDIPYVVGVSAGANAGSNYVAGQRERNHALFVDLVRDRRYQGMATLISERSWFGMNFLFETLPDEALPFDYDAFRGSSRAFTVCVTDCTTARPVYFRHRDCDPREFVRRVMRASSSLPVLSPPVSVSGAKYYDGGVSDPIPIERSLADGNAANVVILTRNAGYQSGPQELGPVSRALLRRYPAIIELTRTRHLHYNACLARVDALEKTGEAFVFRPRRPLVVDRIERNIEKLESLYRQGYAESLERMDELRAWQSSRQA